MKQKTSLGDVISVLVLIGGIFLYRIIGSTLNRPLVFVCLVVCFFQAIRIIKSIDRAWIRPVTLLVLSYLIVNCQVYIDLLLGIVSPTDIIFVNPNTINKGVLLSAISFTALSIGYTKTSYYKSHDKCYSVSISFYRIIQLLCVFFFFVWLFNLTRGEIAGDAYAGSGAYNSSNRYYIEVLFQTSLILCLVCFSKRVNHVDSLVDYLRKLPIILLIISIGYIIIRLSSGDRGAAIYTVILYVFTYSFTSKKTLSIVIAIPFVIIAAIIITSIGLSRYSGSSLSMSEKITYAIDDESAFDARRPSFSPFTSELANSLSCTHVAIDDIENSQNTYHYGVFHVCYVIKFIPFLGTMLVNNILHIPTPYQSSGEYITISRYGVFYESGMGTTTIADDYLEFGLLGVIIGFLLIGFCFKKVDSCLLFSNNLHIPTPMLIFVYVMCFGCFYIPRGVFFMYIRMWLYAFVLYLVLSFLNRT